MRGYGCRLCGGTCVGYAGVLEVIRVTESLTNVKLRGMLLGVGL